MLFDYADVTADYSGDLGKDTQDITVMHKNAYPSQKSMTPINPLQVLNASAPLIFLSGYWQVGIACREGYKENTAFITQKVYFEFTIIHVPLGLCNAPATFQRLMNLACMLSLQVNTEDLFKTLMRLTDCYTISQKEEEFSSGPPNVRVLPLSLNFV